MSGQQQSKRPSRRKKRRGGRRKKKQAIGRGNTPAAHKITAPDDCDSGVPVIVILQPRHYEVFKWIADMQSKTTDQLAQEMLRSAIIKNNPAYREAQGSRASVRTADLGLIVPPDQIKVARGEE